MTIPSATAASLRHHLRGQRSLALILGCLAALPRLVRPDLAEYKLDEATAVLNALAILHHHALPTQGQGSSLAGASQGPLFYYLVAAVLAVSHDPRGVVLAIGLANALAVALSYVIVSRFFNARVGLVTALLFAGGSWSIVFSRKIWPNDLLAPLAVVALWGLLRAADGRTEQPGLGRTWLAIGLMGSLNLSAWPLSVVAAIVQVAVPATRRRRALWFSVAGFVACALAALVEAPSLGVIVRDLTLRTAEHRTFDLSPLGFIVQLVGTDAFRVLAGPGDGFQAGVRLDRALGLLLRGCLFLGLGVVMARSTLYLRGRLGRVQSGTRPTDAIDRFPPEAVVVLWWLTPAVAALDRPVPVYIHHFLATMPAQFVLAALALDWLASRFSQALRTRRLKGGRDLFGRHLTPGNLSFARSGFGLAGTSGRAPRRLPAATAAVALIAFAAYAIQVRSFVALLSYVQAHPSGTYFGVPLGSSLAAARAIRGAACDGPVYLLSDGDLVGVDSLPTVIASLVDRDRAPRFVNASHTLPFPAGMSGTYVVAPGSVQRVQAMLAPWEPVVGQFSASVALPGGYRQLRGRPFTGELPPGWRALDLATEDGGSLLGYAAPRQIYPASRFSVDVLWRVGQPPRDPSEESVFAHLVDAHGRSYGGLDVAPLPTSPWTTGQVVLSHFAITTPRGLPPGPYWILFGRYRRPGVQPIRFLAPDGHTSRTSVDLGPLAVLPPAPTVSGLRPANALFGGQIRLIGWSARQVRETLEISLLWQAAEPPTGDYTVFAHLLSARGALVAQDDSQPRGGKLPTLTWLPGDTVLDTHPVPVERLRPGRYQLAVGLYTLSSGRRLPVGRADSLDLGTVVVR